jgi:alkanesulfonate monooxygenase SsuD/methylene tetrahydromethanopterin reductase-like flavin-dependent oxidoreductase (luciferase family)
MLAEWHDKPAGALYLLPLWHPVLLAEQISTLAAIMPGRFIMQCALGGDRRQSAGMGIDFSRRVGMFEDALAIMQALWRGETVTHERYWRIREARISPLPVNPVEVWVGASAPPAINRAARVAQGWLASPGIPLQTAVDQLNHYRQSCAEHQCEPAATAIRRDVFVGASSQEAQALKERYLQKGYRGFPPEALLTGSVDEVAAQFAAFQEAGYTDIIVRNISDEQGEALATIERLARVREALVA